MAAAVAASAGLLSITGIAVSSAVQGGSHPASGQSGQFLYKSITGDQVAGHKSVTGGKQAAQPVLAFSHQVAAVAATSAAKPEPAKPVAVTEPAKTVAVTEPAKTVAVTKPAVKRQPAKPKAPAGPTKPYRVYDSVTPAAIPAGEVAAVYATGGYATPAASVAGRHVVWIDTRGTDPQANALDVEPGDATPSIAGQWVQQRLSKHPNAVAIVYTMRSEWQQVKDNVGQLPGWMQSKVRYWIADPTGYDHIVPGADATQWYWGSSYDITTANPTFNR